MIDDPFPHHEEWQTRLLISGSRDATPQMLDWARQAVSRAKARRWTIIVGDAVGVDAAVTRAALDLSDDSMLLDGLPRLWCQVYGLESAPRNGVVGAYMNYTRLTKYPDTQTVTYGSRDLHVYVTAGKPITTYAERDRYMIDQAHVVLCIWNGRSPGTRKVYEQAHRANKLCWIMCEKLPAP